jgi:hypothetical protein
MAKEKKDYYGSAVVEIAKGDKTRDYFESPGAYLKRLADDARQKDLMQAGNQLARDAYEERAGLREQAIEARMLGASLADQAVLDQERLGAENLEAINTRTGQAFALSVDPYGMGSGGGSAAAMGDLAQQAALSQTEQRQSNANLLRNVRQKASAQRAEASEYAAKAGSRGSDYAATYAEATEAITNALGDHFESDKRRGVRAAIAKARASQPEVAAALEQQYPKYA